MNEKKDGYRESELPTLLRSMASLSFAVVACIGGFSGLGFLLDKYFHIGATGIIVCTFAGAAVAMYWAYLRVSFLLEKLYRNHKAQEAEDENETISGENNNIGNEGIETDVSVEDELPQ